MRSLQQAFTPKVWELAHVTVVLRKREIMSRNWRNFLDCEILEVIITGKRVNHLEGSSHPADLHDGFRRKKTFTSNLLELCTDLFHAHGSIKSSSKVYRNFKKEKKFGKSLAL